MYTALLADTAFVVSKFFLSLPSHSHPFSTVDIPSPPKKLSAVTHILPSLAVIIVLLARVSTAKYPLYSFSKLQSYIALFVKFIPCSFKYWHWGILFGSRFKDLETNVNCSCCFQRNFVVKTFQKVELFLFKLQFYEANDYLPEDYHESGKKLQFCFKS